MAIQFLADVNADSGTLYVDASAGTVGIGTTSPTNKLEVTGGGGTSLTSTQSVALTVKGGGNGNNIQVWGSSSSQATYAVLTSGGNFGIGTTSPGAKLQIGSATYAPNANLGNNLLQIKSASGFAYLTIGNGDSANATSYIGGASGFTVIGSVADAGTLSEHMRITNTGDVGIGTNSPAEKLTVDGDANVTGKFAVGIAAVHPTIDFYNQGTAYFNGSTTVDDNLIVTNGNVGIGTASPSEKLDVNGTVNLTNLKIATAQGSDGQVLTSTGSGIAWEDVSVSGFLPTTGGTMTGDLRFNDNVYARFGSTGTGDLIIGHVDFGSPYSTILENGSGDLKIQATNLLLESANGETYVDCNFNGSVDLYYNNSKKFETTNTGVSTTGNSIITGNVGIGTTSPSYELDVNGVIRGEQYLRLADTGGTNQFSIRAESTYGTLDNGSKTFNYIASNHLFLVGTSEKMRINSSGNVGIGTSSPGAKLEVNGNSRFVGSMQFYNGSTSNQYLNIFQSGNITFINTGTSGETIYFGAPSSNTTNLYIQGTTQINSIPAATSDTDKFLVSDSGVVKYRTGAQLASDIGAVTGGPFLPLSGGTLTGDLYIPEYLYHAGDTNTYLRFQSDSIELYTGGWKVFGNTTLKYGALYGDNSLRVYATQNGGYVNGSLEVNDYVEANAATDAYKGYIKQTIAAIANEKSATASYNLIPYNTLTTVTTNQYYNRMVAAYDGRVKKVYIRNTGGLTPTATNVNFKKQVNNTTSSTVYAGIVANSASSGMSAYYDFANSDFTFSAGDTFAILYQTTDGFGTASRQMGGVAITIILEYNIT